MSSHEPSIPATRATPPPPQTPTRSERADIAEAEIISDDEQEVWTLLGFHDVRIEVVRRRAEGVRRNSVSCSTSTNMMFIESS